VDLVVWPETMLPVRGLEAEIRRVLHRWRQDDELAFADAMLGLVRDLDVPFLVGSPSFAGLDVDEAKREFTWTAHYNSAYLIDVDGALQRYDKHFLTPFGEVMPYISAWPWLEQRLLALGASGMSFTLDASPEIRRLRLGDDLALATPICFEDAVGRVCRRMVYEDGAKRADVLINLSNDGWFGTHDAGRVGHVQIARFRCIENRVPMVRCANTGLSVSIDSSGRVAGVVGEGGTRYGEPRRAGWLEAPVRLDERHTVYGRIGEAWPWTCLVATLVLTLAAGPGRKGEG
jgi:apolipoprotein N-acyltransferase